MRVAAALLCLDPGAAHLLRRVAVIMAEDAILHPSLPMVVWLMMAAAKGFMMDSCHVEACLAFVWDLARVGVRDVLQRKGRGDDPVAAAAGSSEGEGEVCEESGAGGQEREKVGGIISGSRCGEGCESCGRHGGDMNGAAAEEAATEAAGEAAKEAAEEAAGTAETAGASARTADAGGREEALLLVRSLLARTDYGGMKGDMVMLRRYVSLWHRRFNCATHGARWRAVPRLVYRNTGPPRELLRRLTGTVMRSRGGRGRGTLRGGTAGSANTSEAATAITAAAEQILRRDDIHPSSVDFHVSRVVENVLENPQTRRRAAEADAGEAMRIGASEYDLEDRCRRAMWVHGSSHSEKDVLRWCGSGGGGGDESREGGKGGNTGEGRREGDGGAWVGGESDPGVVVAPAAESLFEGYYERREREETRALWACIKHSARRFAQSLVGSRLQ